MKLRIILIILTVILYNVITQCQILPFIDYSLKDGLVSDNIQAICQDSKGYIWIGTGEGISAFDSRIFHNYYSNDGLSSNNITCIASDKKIPGSIWVGTTSGVNRFTNGKFIRYGQNLPSTMKNINSVFVDKDDNVLCGTDSGFYIIQDNNIKLINNYKIGSVNSFAQISANEIFIASDLGLFSYDLSLNQLKHLTLPNLKNSKIILTLADKDKILFAVSSSGILYRIYKNEIQNFNIKFIPTSIVEDGLNNLWIGGTLGLYKLNKKFSSSSFLKKYTIENGLVQNNISSLYVDKENILWIGTLVNGVSKLTYPNLFRFKISKKYNTGDWASSACDANSHFWISLTGYAMEIWADKNMLWHEYIHKLKDYHSNLLATFFCSNNKKLLVTNPSGVIYIYDIIQNNSLSNIHSQLKLIEKIDLSRRFKFYSIYKTITDADGNLWCSALNLGIIVMDNTKQRKVIKIYKKEDGLPDNSIREIYQDHQGNMWFGGYDGGLSVFSIGKISAEIKKEKTNSKNYIKQFTIDNGLPDNGVRAIIENNLNEIVIGTRYGGVVIYDNRHFRTLTKSSGLYSNAIWSMLKSTNGNIWLGTQSGVQELNKYYQPTYKLFEVLPKVPYYSICSAPNGDLCLANQSDIFIYQRLSVPIYNKNLPIYINNVLIDGQKINIHKNFTLRDDQNTITFEYIGIINRQQRDLRYKYRLIGFDKNWNTVTAKNPLTYAALRPGKYTFQVLAMSENYLKSKYPAEISFIIQSPFYFQLWFILLAVVLAITIIYFISRIGVRQQLEIEKLRNKIASDLHDDIGLGLTKIAILSENASRDELKSYQINSGNLTEKEKFSGNKSLERIGKISRSLIDSMVDVIWSIDPKFDTVEDFISHFKAYAYEVCEAKNIKLNIYTTGIENVKVNSQCKRSLQLITKESLNNALKYSNCTTFIMSLSIVSKNLTLILEDNGYGFDTRESTTGRGLADISKQVGDLKGSFRIISSKDKGTKLIINFLVQK